jgi:hypothetical protein
VIRFGLAAYFCLFLAIPLPSIRGAEIDGKQFQTDLSALCKSPSRVIGSPGYYDAARYLEEEIAKLPNVELQKHEFPVIVPVTKSATLDLADGRVEVVYPFWPAHVRVCSTPAEGIRGRLIYAGECRYQDIKPASLSGNIAVVEASAESRWIEASYVGARAVLILGTPKTTWNELQHHDLRIPVNLPRFYVPPGKLADLLRAGAIPQATLRAAVTWERKMARNYYALVRAPNIVPHGWTSSLPPAALMFSVPFDSSSIVPDLSPGASQGMQAASGLALLRDIAKKPWDRSVVVFFGGADSIQFLGTRNMFLALGSPPVKWRGEIAALERRIADAQRDLKRAGEIAQSPDQLSITADRELIDRVVKIIETDLTTELDDLFRLRSSDPESARESQSRARRLEDRQIELNRLKYAFQQKPVTLNDPGLIRDARGYISRTIARLGGDPNADGLIQQYATRQAELNRRIELYE